MAETLGLTLSEYNYLMALSGLFCGLIVVAFTLILLMDR